MPNLPDTSVCPKCGRALPMDAPQGMCTKCLFAFMLAGGPVTSSPEATVSPDGLPRKFGDYELLEEVARGGMGIVYRARQVELNRLVAVKVIAAGMFAAPDFVKRFRTEAEAAASLDHPNIVPIYEVGEAEGQSFFSMKFVEGGTLAQRLSGSGPALASRDAVALLAKVARAVHFAHQRGILHRDLKPGNVLLDSPGEPYLTDFGLAKLVERDNQLTRTMAMLGTPSYMPPEQARGDSAQLTTAADVYGLGAVFYEMLTGQPPFAGGTTMETVRQVLEKEPRRPSALRTGLDRDLETICLKCLEKDPGRRYASAEALAEDLERWQRHEPIQARPQSGLYVLGKLIRRNKGGTAAFGIILLLVVSGMVFGWWQAGAQRVLREKAEANERVAREAQVQAGHQQKQAEAERHRAEEQLSRAEWLLYASKLMLAQSDFETANGGLAIHYLSQCPEKLRGWEWRYLWNRINARLTLSGHTRVSSVTFSPDGARIVTGGEDRSARVWDATTGQLLLILKNDAFDLYSVAVSPDGQSIVTGGGPGGVGIRPGEAKVWNARTGDPVHLLKGHSFPVWSVGISPDGRRIATVAAERAYTQGGELKLWDAQSGEELYSLPSAENIRPMAFSPDGQRIVTGSAQRTLAVRDAASGQELLKIKGHEKGVTDVAFSPDGQRIVSTGWDPTAKVWDATNGREILTFQGHSAKLYGARFSPDGQRIASVSADKSVRIWDAQTALEIFTFKGHSASVRAVAFSPDGTRVVSASNDGTARVWDAARGQEVPTLAGHGRYVTTIAFRPDSQQIVTGSADGTVKVWDRATGHILNSWVFRKMSAADATVWSVAFSPDGKRVIAGGMDKSAKVWEVETGQELFVLEHTNSVLSLAYSPDGRSIVAGVGWYGEPRPRPGEVRIWDATTGQLRQALAHPKPAWSVAYSPDGRRIVTGSAQDGEVKWWDAARGQELFARSGHRGGVAGIAFSADGRRMVTGGYDSTARIWNADTGEELLVLKGHTGHLLSVAFSPDGQRVVTGSEDRTAKVWETGSGQEVFSFNGHKESVRSVAFSPDSKALVTTDDTIVRIWSEEHPSVP